MFFVLFPVLISYVKPLLLHKNIKKIPELAQYAITLFFMQIQNVIVIFGREWGVILSTLSIVFKYAQKYVSW